MNCKTVEMFIYNYIDGELTEQECIEIEEHLKSCSKCRSLYNYETAFSDFIKSELKKEKVKLPDNLKADIIRNATSNSMSRFNFKATNILKIASVVIFAVFISKFSMGFSTIPAPTSSDFKKKINIVSNDEKKLIKWVKSHNYKLIKPLK